MGDELTIIEKDSVYPVSEDTVLLAENIDIASGKRVLEMGCGTGYVSLRAALLGADVEGVDINRDAVALSRENARRNGITTASFYVSDMFENVKGTYDVILFNPPYLPSEDIEKKAYDACWDGGRDGREVSARFIEGVAKHLAPGGVVYLLQSSLCKPKYSISQLGSQGFKVTEVASKDLFFEELVILRAQR